MAAMLPTQTRARVKVVGVGGAGCNAVTHMVLAGMPHLEFVAVNSDAGSLTACEASVKIRIGNQLTKGVGTGGDPIVGRRAAEQSIEELRGALRGADMIFITTGMGGGAGSGAGPVIAQIAQDLGALTVGVITKPFSFEGNRRRRIADEGAAAFKESMDTVIVLSNDRLLHLGDKKLTMSKAFALADEVIGTTIQSIAGTLTAPGLLTLSFAEMRRLLALGGRTAIGIGRASGVGRAAAAATRALQSPLLERGPEGADSLLFTFAGGNYTSFEVAQATATIMAAAGGGNSTCMGTRVDAGLGKEVEVLVLATGIQDEPQTRRDSGQPPKWSDPGQPSKWSAN
jgi:cell division protein FtsZ